MKIVPLTAKRVRSWLPRRPLDSHKGLNGHVLIIAGSRGMSGAAVLAALGALRAGAGWVTVAIVEGERLAVTARVPEALTWPLPQAREGVVGPGAFRVLDRCFRNRRVQSVAIGPGLSVHPSVRRMILAILQKWRVPIVLDADALNNINKREVPKRAGLVLTPHAGELARFMGVDIKAVQREGPRLVETLARRLPGVCLLKGHRTLITDGARTFRNTTGNPAMAAGGMGDVLTGAIAALLGQGAAPLEAAAAGAFLHGLAGDLARVADRGLLASELASAFPAALKKIGVN